eukprot:Mycagemm_TRINITY_DN10084_c0_g1::TRINITY_DN10084_c0_g1_i1::g.2128::m.2128 type:complete len:128 gc:universal TRINITY_DN10084_c0_g1_i1:107-490(+)
MRWTLSAETELLPTSAPDSVSGIHFCTEPVLTASPQRGWRMLTSTVHGTPARPRSSLYAATSRRAHSPGRMPSRLGESPCFLGLPAECGSSSAGLKIASAFPSAPKSVYVPPSPSAMGSGALPASRP